MNTHPIQRAPLEASVQTWRGESVNYREREYTRWQKMKSVAEILWSSRLVIGFIALWRLSDTLNSQQILFSGAILLLMILWAV